MYDKDAPVQLGLSGRFVFITVLVATMACGHGSSNDTDVLDSGFLSDTHSGNDDGAETWGDGELRGILSYNFYAADAITDEDQVGIAGAWRTDVDLVEQVDDFHAAIAFQTAFPLPPEEPDTLEQNDIPPGFTWEGPDTWLEAGSAFKLEGPEGPAMACLLWVGMGPVDDNLNHEQWAPYPIYAATQSAQSPEECTPTATAYAPGKDYDIVMYGGDLFDTRRYVGAVETPRSFDVTAPDLLAYNDPVVQADGLTIAWDGKGTEHDRMVIRVWDDQGRMFTVLATDDGRYDIPGSAFSELALGPITVTIAREHIERIPFDQGGVKVVTRFERRGYFDLVAAPPQ